MDMSIEQVRMIRAASFAVLEREEKARNRK